MVFSKDDYEVYNSVAFLNMRTKMEGISSLSEGETYT